MALDRTCLALSSLAAVLLLSSCKGAEEVCNPTDPLCAELASVTTTAGDGQSAPAGTALPVAPAVTVRDASGSPVNGVIVTFAVSSGGGTVTGSPASSNASGVATVGSWTLGATAGANTLTAAVGSLPAVTFTATGTDPCAQSTPHTIGTTSNGVLTSTDCRLSNGSYLDYYSTTTSSASAYRFTQTSSFDTYLLLLMPSGVLIAEDDNAGAGTNSAIKALLPSGSYLLGANSPDAGVVGSYTVSSATTSDDVANCEEVYTVRGMTTTQSVETTDCREGTDRGDSFWILLQSGQSVTIRHASTAFDAFLKLYNEPGTLVALNDDTNGLDSEIVFTPPSTGYYRIFATTRGGLTATGAYTLTIP